MVGMTLFGACLTNALQSPFLLAIATYVNGLPPRVWARHSERAATIADSIGIFLRHDACTDAIVGMNGSTAHGSGSNSLKGFEYLGRVLPIQSNAKHGTDAKASSICLRCSAQ
jgi:hypothetical protein